MEHANLFLTNLAVVLCVAAATTVLFQRLRQPVVHVLAVAGTHESVDAARDLLRQKKPDVRQRPKGGG